MDRVADVGVPALCRRHGSCGQVRGVLWLASPVTKACSEQARMAGRDHSGLLRHCYRLQDREGRGCIEKHTTGAGFCVNFDTFGGANMWIKGSKGSAKDQRGQSRLITLRIASVRARCVGDVHTIAPCLFGAVQRPVCLLYKELGWVVPGRRQAGHAKAGGDDACGYAGMWQRQ